MQANGPPKSILPVLNFNARCLLYVSVRVGAFCLNQLSLGCLEYAQAKVDVRSSLRCWTKLARTRYLGERLFGMETSTIRWQTTPVCPPRPILVRMTFVAGSEGHLFSAISLIWKGLSSSLIVFGWQGLAPAANDSCSLFGQHVYGREGGKREAFGCSGGHCVDAEMFRALIIGCLSR